MKKKNDEKRRLARANKLLGAAIAVPPAECEAFVRKQAGTDVALADEVLAMLREADEGMTVAQSGGQSGASGVSGLGEQVQSTATSELLQRLASAPKLDSNRYQLQGEVGHGGMGMVMRIHDAHLNRRLAMKVLLEGPAPQTPEEQKLQHQNLGRFLEEAQVTSQLDHPGVVPVHELGLDQSGKVYFTMRLVKGRTADDIFTLARDAKEDWTTTRALEIILKICDTMAYAHAKGVLHRDLKPANVMVGRFGEVYVMDWGLAKVIGQEDQHDLRIRAEQAPSITRLDTARKRDAEGGSGASVVSLDGQTLGTPSYMSPEQARSEVLDQRADVYSIGAVMYKLLTGRPPYLVPGVRKAAYRILDEVAEGPPKPIEEITKGVPAELVAIVDMAMARDREQRYASTTKLAADLRAYLGQRVVAAYRTGALVEMKLWVRRNRALASALAAAVLILVAGVAGMTVLATWAEANATEAREQKGKAEANELLANERAEENAKLAQEKTALATAETMAKEQFAGKVREFNLLAGRVLYDRVIISKNDLYPAWPAKIAAMEQWLLDAGKLLAMKRDIEATRRDLEARAVPRATEAQAADPRVPAKVAEFGLLEKQVASLRHAQAMRAGKTPPAVPLTAAQQALDATGLNALAWERVAPPAKAGQPEERKVHGEEALGLACARAAVAKSADSDHDYRMLDTLAWALLANGQDVEASSRSAEALAKAPDHEMGRYVVYQRDLEWAVTNAATLLATAEMRLAELLAANDRRTSDFELESQRFLYDTLADLLGKLALLEAREKTAVDKLLAWAKQIQELSLHHPNGKHRWPEVRAAIASSAKYAGRTIELRDADITGLVPIGENPVTHLWEFYELRSAWDGKRDPAQIPIPTHRADGSIAMTDDTGIVFVLLPGGTVELGAQNAAEDEPNYDPGATEDETPYEVTLAPFFLARHELTQGQWARLWLGDETQRWPSYYKVGGVYKGIPITVGLSHPVEYVHWDMSEQLLRQSGLCLPTEAQWEYGCRAAQATPWYTGEQAASLAGHANILDLDAVKDYPGWGKADAIEDGFAGTAPVGNYRGTNAFGLWDVHGNVWEWCQDLYTRDDAARQAGDGLRLGGSASGDRVSRGGSFRQPAVFARSADRLPSAPSSQGQTLGLRAARTLTP